VVQSEPAGRLSSFSPTRASSCAGWTVGQIDGVAPLAAVWVVFIRAGMANEAAKGQGQYCGLGWMSNADAVVGYHETRDQ